VNLTSSPSDDLAIRSFPVRFRAYLAERFPLGSYATLISLFFLAGYLAAQAMTEPSHLLVGPRAAAGFAVIFGAFLVLRFLDEFKDYDLDRKIHPERLVSRGVIRLSELGVLTGLAAAGMLAVSLPLGLPALEWCGAVLFMLVLLWREFFIPKLLARSYAVFAAAHQLLHPALVGFCFACWTAPTGRALVTAGLYSLFAAFSFLAFDVGRKLLPPELEREGYDTYSSMYGTRPAAWLGMALLAAASVALAAMEWTLGAALWVFPGIGAAWLLSAWGFVGFLRTPNERSAGKLKNFASINMMLGFLLIIIDLVARHGVRFTAAW
jgi:hypothetical protein